VLLRYEALRAALADDRADSVGGEAAALRAAALELLTSHGPAAAAVQKGADALLAVATPAAGTPVDMKAVRVAFGELSRGVVALVAGDPALQTGRFLFECPMARGYQRWVQLTPTMANPYMGKRMLECGSPVPAWRVEG
jgi:Cu(I)/Ag(I) efflux system membrane fusion protein